MPTESFQADGVEIPWLDPRKILECLVDDGNLHLFHADLDLLAFWHRFSKVQRSHPLFTRSMPLNRVIPFLSHGDEGRTKKKRGILIWSMKGVGGHGARQFQQMPMEFKKQRLGGPNLNSALLSRFPHFAVPARLYKNRDALWDALAAKVGEGYRDLLDRGFLVNGQTWYACCVGLTGDVPFLTKAASLQRHFLRASKKQRQGSSTSQGLAGVCFACLAGTDNCPFEDVRVEPTWLSTVSTAPLPWSRTPAFLEALGDLRPEVLQYDWWPD